MSFLIFLLFLSFPTQLAKHFWPSLSYIWGIRVDFLSPAIYLSDILVLTIITVFFFQAEFKRKLFDKYTFLIVVYVVSNILFSLKPEVAIIKWLKILEIGLLAYFFSSFKFSNVKRQILLPLLISGTVVSLLGLAQFIKGSTLGGVFYFLGERSFNLISPGIALVSIGGRDFLRAYSTFSHPNSMAGYLLILGILTVYLGKGYRFWLIPVLVAFVLTFSKGAFIALVLIIFFKKCRYKTLTWVLVLGIVLSLVMLFTSDRGWGSSIRIAERMDLVNIAKGLILKRPLLGIGMNNFILANPGWLLQPVHNIFILSLAEGGVVWLLMIFFIFYDALSKTLKKKSAFLTYSLIVIIITGLIDHYWFTLQQNMLILSLVFGLTYNKNIK